MAGPTSNRATLVPGVPFPAVGPDTTEPYSVVPPAQQSPQADPLERVASAVTDRVLDRLGRMRGGGGPLASGAIGGAVVAALISAFHASSSGDDLSRRIDRLEAGMMAADEHNAWVQAALVALSKAEPLPPPPYRRLAPP
jgi:hypothetical protein